jgi:hypothetical protein
MKYEITKSVRSVNFTAAQIKWASEHDWFVSVNDNGNIVCRDEYWDGTSNIVVHNSFQDLRDWAGY